MIWLKRLGYLIVGFAALIVLAIVCLYVITGLQFAKHYAVIAVPVETRSDSATMARGEHLVVTMGKCARCHGPDLGGMPLGTGSFMIGHLAGSNLTTGRGGVFSRYDDATVARAIRHGIRGDGTPLFFMPSEAFSAMSDEDVAATIAYLRSRPPVDRELPAPRIGPMMRLMGLLTSFPLVPARRIDHAAVSPKAVPEEPTEGYGKYLVQMGLCTGCHGAGLNGQALGPGAKPSMNLTRAAIGDWTESDLVRALRQGKQPSGVALDSTAMPWPLTARMTDSEIHAIWLYLRSVPPKEFGVK
jgi:mono/diheme cytochrome c family protein